MLAPWLLLPSLLFGRTPGGSLGSGLRPEWIRANSSGFWAFWDLVGRRRASFRGCVVWLAQRTTGFRNGDVFFAGQWTSCWGLASLVSLDHLMLDRRRSKPKGSPSHSKPSVHCLALTISKKHTQARSGVHKKFTGLGSWGRREFGQNPAEYPILECPPPENAAENSPKHP